MSKSDDEIFTLLTESAFEFLERSVNEFPEHPKFSTINFATAVELFLKARLMVEHWTLVVENSDKATRKKFEAAQEKTISIGSAIGRLRNMIEVPISPDAETAFKKISDHRNMMVHFVHEHDAPQQNKKVLLSISTEQLHGWWQLKKLLDDWSSCFSDWQDRANQIAYLMNKHRSFLNVTYEIVRPKIEEKSQRGISFRTCDVCSYPAAELTALTSHIFESTCLVCAANEKLIQIDCPSPTCNAKVSVSCDMLGLGSSCDQCNATLCADDLVEALSTEEYDPDDTECVTPKNCAACDSPGSVVQHNKYYVCTECVATTTVIQQCGWCNEFQIEGRDLEFSEYQGCNFCEGKRGWIGDD